ncbi:shikimate dehydrogenase [Sphingomonas piscis]|uniref:Shikimate dehydrogenase (NADP(+)) n=1 Tax=Sphingomonas piscis TaxID=2714943 RepID=A0A6G7YNI3_9SPHN|nr:shikimate dehydrogenase [Sphingomonas piscis]QIK78303.1 shikimate dehydrogenase [Sphingomonas piscis]
MPPFAEVIGDPIAHSKSPALHGHWLSKLGLVGEYRAQSVEAAGLAAYLNGRRADPDWRGCNVTIPHKERIAPLLDQVSPDAAAIGAVNCVVRADYGLWGYNTDVDGIVAALGEKPLGSRKVAVIGAGGAARAMLAYLAGRSPSEVTIIARDPLKAEGLRSAAPDLSLNFASLDSAHDALADAALIVNASPLGMDGLPPMPEPLLRAVEDNARGTILFDMVYQPLRTGFLRRGAAAGGEPVDGLTMLIGQARSAFELFFRTEPPQADEELRALLTGATRTS